MKMTVSVFLLATLAVFAYGTQESRDLRVTCKAPAVHVGDTGRVTCYFNSDVRQLPRPVSLSVDFYPHQLNTSDMVAECNWKHKGDTGCQVKRPGHKFFVTDSGDMALEIAQVRADHVGRYVCQQMYSNRPDSSPEPCFLFVNESKQPGPAVTTPPREDSEPKNEGLHQNEAEDKKLWIIGVIVALVVVVVIGLVVYFWGRRLARHVCGGTEDNKPTESTRAAGNQTPTTGDEAAESLNAMEMGEASYPDANAERLPAAEHERRNDGNGNGEETQPLMEGDGAEQHKTTTLERRRGSGGKGGIMQSAAERGEEADTSEAMYPDDNAERLPAAEHERRNDGNGNGEEVQPLMEGDGAEQHETTTLESQAVSSAMEEGKRGARLSRTAEAARAAGTQYVRNRLGTLGRHFLAKRKSLRKTHGPTRRKNKD